MTPIATPPGVILRAVVLLVALLAVAIPAFVVRHPPVVAPLRARPTLARLQQQVVPPTVVPAVEPVEFVDLLPDEARAFNASVPFSTDPAPPARPFHLRDGPEDVARATDCLAAAVLYEAGDDADGQRAVAQVVVNRVRHPAFAKTICGVVFEGEDRATGCQFSFTCDHALTRWTPTPAMWEAARKVAVAALSGAVYRPVGYATHYHTDWVVPYWQSSLDKIARVHSHLFFRWTGWWGTPPAFVRQVLPGEPTIEQLAILSDAHRTAATRAEADAVIAEASAAMGFAAEVEPLSPVAPVPMSMPVPVPVPLAATGGDTPIFLIKLDRRDPADSFRVTALMLCAERPRCTVMGWTDAAAKPSVLPMEAAQSAAMSFSYLRDRAAQFERTLWNCAEFKRTRILECMKRPQAIRSEPLAGTTLPGGASVPPLGGVRRRPPSVDATTP